jgi:hypothetical protein
VFRGLARITETADPNAVPGRAYRVWLERPLRSRLYVRPGSITGVAARPRSSIAAMTHEAMKVFEENRTPTHI